MNNCQEAVRCASVRPSHVSSPSTLELEIGNQTKKNIITENRILAHNLMIDSTSSLERHQKRVCVSNVWYGVVSERRETLPPKKFPEVAG